MGTQGTPTRCENAEDCAEKTLRAVRKTPPGRAVIVGKGVGVTAQGVGPRPDLGPVPQSR
jgi:hypothetical protein